ncbi:Non-reducing end alpha-L-arabinofuranosidase BoGH43B [Mycena venus]|uniref:Non-reducing end alpha-L-arabinofuranosidase BoGH43B n=1 Tax=Mycena venus TaxID=2733690 RepID=A0A8H6U0B1_9AGAR|nr:Non-reducing end alpha-L-arabinofuranosidase BoGH43B [Mycena venus]
MNLNRLIAICGYVAFCLPFHVLGLINPILPGWNPDPSILRVGSDYFIATSTFEYFPGHPIYHSTDLVSWKLIGHGLNRPSQLSLFGTPIDAGTGTDTGIWAPSLRYHAQTKTFYLASTARYAYTAEYRLFPRSFYVTTQDIFADNWSDPIYFDALGYDTDLFWDTNGDVYATWSGNNNAVDKIYSIYQNKIDIATGTSLTDAQLIFHGTLPDNSSARPEGPHVYLINSTYYLLIAEGGSGPQHRSTIQRGPSPSGPWENNPNNPILFNGANLSLPVQDTGHSDIVQAPDGSWWGVALGVRPQGGDFNHQQLGRETFLFPVTWEDGWPVFNGGQPISEHIEGVLEDKSPLATDNPALLLRKQTSYEETFETLLDFAPRSNLTEAGVTIFYSDLLHNDIAVVGDGNGGRQIITRTNVQAMQVGPWALTYTNSTITTVNHIPLTTQTGPVKFRIIGNSTSYSLGYAEGSSADFIFPVTIDSVLLSVPPVGGFFFKGAAFGVYNTGNGKPSLAPADFEYWKQTPVL